MIGWLHGKMTEGKRNRKRALTRPGGVAYARGMHSPVLRWRLSWLLVLAAACAGTGAVRSEEVVPHKRVETMRTRDGVELSADVYLPEGNGPFPVVLVRTPYNKEGVLGIGRDGVKNGFAVVAQDTRGRFASQGENLPFHLDGPDGEDLVRWVKAQSWCNGRIGSWGGSVGAITQFQLAATGVQPLQAQYLIVGAPNLYDVVYTGGVFRKSMIEDWIRVVKFQSNALPIWVQHPRYDEYWRARDASRQYGRISAAGVHVGGWWDIFAQATIDAFVGYQEHGARGARGKQKLIMGPWTHGVFQEKAGELKFPDAKNPPGDTENAWRWFDRQLKGKDNGADGDPAVRYYVIGDVSDSSAPGNVWRSANAWPPVASTDVRYYLQPNRGLSPRRPAPNSPPLSYTYHPTNPVPTVGGIQLTLPAGPMDQRPIEGRDDVLVFTSEALKEPVEVTGRVRARLWIASDAPDTDFHVRLCDVYPDGRSFNLCEGMLRARFRGGRDAERRLTPGRVTEVDVDLWSTSVIFNRGHAIRVHVTSSSAPGFDPNPNTGAGFRENADVRPARNQVFVDGRHASWVSLPVVRGER